MIDAIGELLMSLTIPRFINDVVSLETGEGCVFLV